MLTTAKKTNHPPKGVRLMALFDYPTEEQDEIELVAYKEYVGLYLVEPENTWWYGKELNGQKSGIFPANYVTHIVDTQPAASKPAASKGNEKSAKKNKIENPLRTVKAVKVPVQSFSTKQNDISTNSRNYGKIIAMLFLIILLLATAIGLILNYKR